MSEVLDFGGALKLRDTNNVLRLWKRGLGAAEIGERLKLPEKNVRRVMSLTRRRWIKDGDELRDAVKAKLDAQYDAVLVATWDAWERSLEEEQESLQALHSGGKGGDRKIASMKKRRPKAQPQLMHVILRALEDKAELHGLRQPAQVFVSARASAHGLNARAQTNVLVIQGGHEINLDALRTIRAVGEPEPELAGLPPVLDVAAVPLP